jgi:hypothetical protein
MNSAERVPKYLAYESAARRDLAVGMIRSLKNRRNDWQERWKRYAVRHGRDAKTSPYAFDETRGWSGKSLREIARLIERRYGNEGIWMDYEFFYTLGSAVTHSSALSMQEYLSRPHAVSYRKLGQRRRYLRELPVLSCRWCLILGILSTKDHDREADDVAICDVFLEALRLLDALTNEIEGGDVSIVSDILAKLTPASS